MIRFEYKKIGLFTAALFIFSYYSLTAQIITGAQQIDNYLPLIKGKRVGLVVNQTSVINQTHLVDTLQKLNVNIITIFAPEHAKEPDYQFFRFMAKTINLVLK